MSDFPTTIQLPSQVSVAPVENAIKSDPSAGKVMTRRRFTRSTGIYTASWSNMTDADLGTVLAQYATVETWATFAWVYDGTTYTVRYAKPIEAVNRPADQNPVTVTFQSV